MFRKLPDRAVWSLVRHPVNMVVDLCVYRLLVSAGNDLPVVAVYDFGGWGASGSWELRKRRVKNQVPT